MNFILNDKQEEEEDKKEKEFLENLHENEDTISKILLKIKIYFFEDFKKLNELFFEWNPKSRRKRKLKMELSQIFYSNIKSKL